MKEESSVRESTYEKWIVFVASRREDIIQMSNFLDATRTDITCEFKQHEAGTASGFMGAAGNKEIL